jgi:hypothetical protein
MSASFFWITATTFCTVLAPPEVITTLIGTSVMVHFGVGKGVGSFLGGLLIANLELKHAFRIVGIIALCLGILFKVANVILDRNRSSKREYEVIEEEEGEEEDTIVAGPLFRRHSIVEDGLYRRFSVTYDSLLME